MPTNRLINEKSPYLLQHAHNPVEWFPWGEEAFDKAKKDDKPIFLSIGYATCHWCHVMERESFEDLEVAKLLNDGYVSIKVDREERPDIDAVYMAVCHMLTGNGGWPLSIVMTPDKQPFFAGTYIPKNGRFGRTGLMELGPRLEHLWRNQRKDVLSAAAGIVSAIDGVFDFENDPAPSRQLFQNATGRLEKSFDPDYGGFDGAPKFPTPHRLRYLLGQHRRTGDERALAMATKTLYAMRLGGIWDHVGFGFHRYSTDAEWRVPHFEKMLYDQALLAMAYLEAFEATGDSFFSQTAEEVFAYVLRDLKNPIGGFCTAEDADSEGEEGKFYVWSKAEFRDTLKDENPQRWEDVFGISDGGNFHDEASRKLTGTNIPYLKAPLSSAADALKLAPADLENGWEQARGLLFSRRSVRARPLLDDKVLCDWNGLMIAALAMGSRILKKPEYGQIAADAARFILDRMTDGSGRLYHRFRDHDTAIEGQASDYAFFIMGLIELYRASSESHFLNTAIRLQNQMIADFKDNDNGGYFMTAHHAEPLPARPKELYDGATPSANSVTFSNLTWLFQLTQHPEFKEEAQSLVKGCAGSVNRQPVAYTHFLMGLDLFLNSGSDSGSRNPA